MKKVLLLALFIAFSPFFAAAQAYGSPYAGQGGYSYPPGYVPGQVYGYGYGHAPSAPPAGNYATAFHPEALGYATSYNTYYPPYYYGHVYPAYYPHYGSQTPYAPNQYSFRDYPPPATYQSPTGMYDLLGTPLCNWSDYPTSAPCGSDPQQWVQDIYTGQWY